MVAVTEDMYRLGESLWRRLLSAGGFVCCHADGSKSVHFNRGRTCPPDLKIDLVQNRALLRDFVAEKNRSDVELDRRGRELYEHELAHAPTRGGRFWAKEKDSMLITAKVSDID